MASPQLQQAIQVFRDFWAKVGTEFDVQKLRASYEELAVSPASDVSTTPVDADGVRAEWAVAPGIADDRVIIYFHGGGYVIGSLRTHRDMATRISRAAQARVLAIDYRLAPEHPFPAAVEDAIAAYQWLVSQAIPPRRIVIVGDSAGGGLTLATLIALRDANSPLPAAGVCISPWIDLEATGESMTTRAAVDPVAQREGILNMAETYLNGVDPKTPLAAPLHANLERLPPLLIQVGDAETLLDDSTRLAKRARDAGVDVKLEVWDEMIHVWHFFASFLPEGQQAIEQIGAVVRERTD